MIERFLNPKQILESAGLKAEDKFADLGCGSGFFVIEASKIVGEKGIVYAVDIQKIVLLNIKSKLITSGIKNVKLIWADLEIPGSTRIKDAEVDFVLVANVLFQVLKKKEVLKEAYRILKPNGKLCIIDWKLNASEFGPTIDERVSIQDIKAICDEIGFENKIFEGDASNFHWELIYRK